MSRKMEGREEGGRVWICSRLFRGRSWDGLEMMKKLLASLSASTVAAGSYLSPPAFFVFLSHSTASSFLLRRRVPKNLGPRSIHLNIIISFRELGFQGILISLFLILSRSPSLLLPSIPLSSRDDLIVRSARESSTSLFPPPL